MDMDFTNCKTGQSKYLYSVAYLINYLWRGGGFSPGNRLKVLRKFCQILISQKISYNDNIYCQDRIQLLKNLCSLCSLKIPTQNLNYNPDEIMDKERFRKVCGAAGYQIPSSFTLPTKLVVDSSSHHLVPNVIKYRSSLPIKKKWKKKKISLN